MAKSTDTSSTTSPHGTGKTKQPSPFRYFARWLYRVVFVFLGTTIIVTVIQALLTLQGADLLSNFQNFLFARLAIGYPVPFLLISIIFLALGVGGFVIDRVLTKEEQTEQTESVKKAVKDSLLEILEHPERAPGLSLQQAMVLRSRWSGIPGILEFVGREVALDRLVGWTVRESCRVVAVLGFGGIGKTSLVAKLAHEVKDQFDLVYWLTLQNAPPFEATLSSILRLVSRQQRIDLPEGDDEQIALLLGYLKTFRCLLVLDNWETLLRDGDHTGGYHIGFEVYGKLLRRIAEADHRSCLIVTSREKPRDFAVLEANNSLVHSLEVKGLQVSEARLILTKEGLVGAPQDWNRLIQLYAGNPLYLKLAAEPIRELFGGQIGAFLATGEGIFGSLEDPLALQFNQLSALERNVLYWLAIEREATTLNTLVQNFIGLVTKRDVLAALDALRRRSMIEVSGPQLFGLQPVILEYVTAQFVEQVVAEVANQAPNLFASHALLKARAKDYVRNSQSQLLLKPITERLIASLGKEGVASRLKQMLIVLRDAPGSQSTYTAGNILNLLIQAESDLRGYDFSHLTIRQAYLQGVAAPDINFAFSHMEDSVFTDTFGGVLSLASNHINTLLAAGLTTGEVRLWQLPEGRPLRTLQGHTDWVRSVAFTPDGARLVSSSEDLTIRVWDVESGQCLQILQGHVHWVRCIAVHPDGTLLASAGGDGATKVWDLTTGVCLLTLPEQVTQVRSVAFSPDGKLLANSSGDATIRLWEVATWQPLYTLDGHTATVWCVTFSPDGRYLASTSRDKTVRLWDLEQRACLRTLTGHTDQIWSVTFSPDGLILVSTSEDQTARVWTTNTFELLLTLQGHTDRVWASVFTPDSQTVLTASQDQSIRFWDLGSSQQVATLRGYTSPVNAVAFHPSSRLLAAATSEPAIHIWDTKTALLQIVFRGHVRAVRSVVFSPDGRFLASGSEDCTIRLWDMQTGECLEVLKGHDNWVEAVAFSPDGRFLASGSLDTTVRIWEVNPKHGTQFIQVLRAFSNHVWAVAFSPDGTKLAAGTSNASTPVWEVEGWRFLYMVQGQLIRIQSLCFSPKGECLATAGTDQLVRLWDAETGSLVSTLAGHTHSVWTVAFSPDGTILASGGGDRTVRLWAVENGQGITELQGHSNLVTSLQFSPDGQLLASGSEDGTVRLWNPKTQKYLAALSSARPYERMDITAVSGISPAERAALLILGAVERPNKALKLGKVR